MRVLLGIPVDHCVTLNVFKISRRKNADFWTSFGRNSDRRDTAGWSESLVP